MNSTLFFIGLGKVAFGIVVGAFGIFIATRLFARLTKLGKVDEELGKGNTAAGALVASAILSLGILAQHAVIATFAAMDLAYHNEAFEVSMLAVFGIYGLAHVLTSFTVGLGVLVLGTLVFGWLTRGVDELAEIRKGNVAPALVLAGVIVVLAMLTAPGLQTALDGLLPLPTLARDEMMAPS